MVKMTRYETWETKSLVIVYLDVKFTAITNLHWDWESQRNESSIYEELK